MNEDNPIFTSAMNNLNLQLAQLPADTRGALIAHADLSGNLKIAAVTKLGDGSWKLSAEFEKKVKQKPSGAINVIKTW
jgi:hypothetical protein